MSLMKLAVDGLDGRPGGVAQTLLMMPAEGEAGYRACAVVTDDVVIRGIRSSCGPSSRVGDGGAWQG